MPGQLIYTSAPQGLAAGQSGYCTVARDGTLRETLIRALEQLSSFRHAPSAGQHNPVISAYRILDLRGAKYHVLSRIQDAGLDFTNRTNHLAHHLVLEPHELANLPSPALIFRDWNGWRKEWKESPRLLGPSDLGNLSQIPRSIALPAKHWAGATGDAGSAAGLLEREFASGGFILADSAVLLPLFAESLQLLATSGKSQVDLWQYTFTTRLQPEDNPNDFRWRGCQTDSPAYLAAVRKGASFTAVNSIKAPANDLAQCARTGKSPIPEVRLRPTNRPQPAPLRTVLTAEPQPRPPEPVSVKGWDRDPSHYEPEDDEPEQESRPASRGPLWSLGLVILLVVIGGWAWLGSHHQPGGQDGQGENKVSTNTNEVVGSSPTNPASGTEPLPVQSVPTNQAQRTSPPDKGSKWADRLPDFKTYLVGVTSENIPVNTISNLSNVCDLLKQKIILDEMKDIMECRIRTDDPLLNNESPISSVVSFELRNNDLKSEKFSIEGWNSFNPPKEGTAVIDFSSPHGKFEKFRIVTFPSGVANQPPRFPKSLLRANQSSFPACFEPMLYNRIAKLDGEGWLQLRPFVKVNGNVQDMIAELPPPVAKYATANRNELNFDKLRTVVSSELERLSSQANQIQQETSSLESKYTEAANTVKSRQVDVKNATEDNQRQTAIKALNDSKNSLSEAQKRLFESQKRQAEKNNELTRHRQCLDIIPADLSNPNLDHVSLFYVTGSPNKPGEKFELIRFDDSEEGK